MNKFSNSAGFRLGCVALASLLTCAGAQAQSRTEEASLSVGLGANDGLSSDRGLIDPYGDSRSAKHSMALVDAQYSVRDPDAQSWLEFSGTNILREERDLSLVWKRPGDWRVSADYKGITHYDPVTVNTGLTGSGSVNPQVVRLNGGPGSGSDLELMVKRTGLGLGLAKWVTPTMQLEVDLKSEKKQGSRLFGIGMTCPSPVAPGCGVTTGTQLGWATLMLPEPIDANHTQVDARLSYAWNRLHVTLGYYGSFFRNENAQFKASVPTSLNNALGEGLTLNAGLLSLLLLPVALAPDNQAHQWDVSGNYSLTPQTQATFKLAYGRATQDQAFVGAGFTGAPSNVSSLGAQIDTRMIRLGLSGRPLPQLSWLGEWRHESRDDNTPLAAYNVVGSSSWTNAIQSYDKTHAKVQAAWQFSSAYRASAGADYEEINRSPFTASSAIYGTSALRQNTRENTVFAELRQRMTGQFSGSLKLSSSRRDGSNWLKPNAGLGVSEVSNPTDVANGFLPNSVFMPTLANRNRDKARLYGEWQPNDSLTLQFSAEGGNDRYVTPLATGLRDSHMDQYSVDLNYALSFAWNLTGYVSKSAQTYAQIRPAGYVLAFGNTNVSAGLGITGKLNSDFEVGASLSYLNDESVYEQTLDRQASADSVALLAATGGLPTVTVQQSVIQLFGKYNIDKKSSVRLSLVHQRATTNDWTWGSNGVPYVFSDGTTVSQKPLQRAGFVAVNYTYRW